MDDDADLDYAALFDATPVPCVVLDRDLVILAVNRACLRVMGRSREELVGQHVFAAFPGNPGDPGGDGVRNLRASLERVLRTGLPDTMPLQKYDIRGDSADGFVERYWSAVNVPVLDEHGSLRWLLHRTEDVTELVTARDRVSVSEDDDARRARSGPVAAELPGRAQELRADQVAGATAARRLTALADVALALSGAQSVDELTSIVVDVGLRAVGADGGAVAVRDDTAGILRMAFASLNEATRQRFQGIALDGPLPASVTARTGQRLLLGDRSAGLAWSPVMADVHAATGLEAWASLPLRSDGRLLGAMTVGWRGAQEFADDQVELLEAFAAQCAQALDRMQRLTAERQHADLARQLAETLQRSLLTPPPQPDHLEIVARYLPAAQEVQVGGDWFDAFVTPDGSTSLVIGDVTGHDEHSVAAMGQIRNILRGVAYTLVEPPGAVLAALDRTLRGVAVDTLATVVLADITQTPADAARGVRRFRWSNAGHLPPLLLPAGGEARFLLRPPELLLGVKPDVPREHAEVELSVGDTVLLFTDGLVEHRGEHLESGLDRLRGTAQELTRLPLEELCDALLHRLEPARDDDIALAAVRLHPQDRPQPDHCGDG